MAGLTLSDIASVELIGGAIRVPSVKRTLEEYFKASKLDLGTHLNGDEAMALGASFRAANLSTSFRVRKVGMNDISAFGINIKLDTLPTTTTASSGGFFGFLQGKKNKELKGGEGTAKDGDKEEAEVGEGWSKSTLLYPYKSLLGKQKTVALNYDKDIVCRIEVLYGFVSSNIRSFR